MNIKKTFNVSSTIFGVVVLLTIILHIGPSSIISHFAHMNVFLFFLAGIVYLIGNLMIALKLLVLFPVSTTKAFLSHEIGMFYSNITPAKIGYYYTAYSLAKKTKTSITENTGILTMLQTITIIIKIFLLSVAVFYFSLTSLHLIILFLFPLLIILASLIVLFTHIPQRVLKTLPLFNKIIRYINLMQSAMKKYTKPIIVKYIVLDVLGWLILGIQWFLIFHSIGFEVDYLFCLMLQPVITILMYVPLSPNGLGITEAGNTMLFSFLNISTPAAIAFLLVLRLNTLLFDTIGLIDKFHRT